LLAPLLLERGHKETQRDYQLILPWNLVDEITAQMGYIRDWGGQFVVPIPAVWVMP
jgi:C-methyltransferase C-terminal domain